MKKSLLMLFAMLVSSASAFAGIRVADVTTTAGSTVEVAVLFENEANISWFNFNVSLPGGFTTVKDASGNLDCALGFNGTNHVIEYGTNGRVEIVESAYGAIPSNCKLVTFKFNVGATVKDDYYTGKITNISYVGTNHAGGTKGDVSFTIKVGDAKYDFKNINVKFGTDFDGYDWTGAQIKPEYDIWPYTLNDIITSVTLNGKVLMNGRDFKIDYKTLPADANIDAGTGQIYFVGMGDYKPDTCKVNFPIKKIDPVYINHGITALAGTDYYLQYEHALGYDKDLKVTYPIQADSVQQIATVDTLVAEAIGGKIAWSVDGTSWFNQDDFQDDPADKKDRKTRGQKFDEKMKATLVGTHAGGLFGPDEDTRYKVYYKVKGDKNHNDYFEKDWMFEYATIDKAPATWSWSKDTKAKKYVQDKPKKVDVYSDGTTKNVLVAGKSWDGTMYYNLNEYDEQNESGGFVDWVWSSSTSTDIPQGTTPGYYYIQVMIKGDQNHWDHWFSWSSWDGSSRIRPSEFTTYSGGNKFIGKRSGTPEKYTERLISVEAANSTVSVPTKYVSIDEGAFAGTTGVTDIYLNSSKKVALQQDALTIPDGVATIHTPIDLLGDYALDAALKDNFEAGKVQSDVYLRGGLNTFCSTVDVLVPDVVEAVYTATTNADGVLLNEVLDLDVNGEDAILAGNGVILESSVWGTVPFVAWNGRMLSNDAPVKSQQMDYGVNELVPVFAATHFDPATVYVLNDGQFKAVNDDDTSKVPAGKAVLKTAVELAARTLDILNAGVTGISELQNDDKDGEIYNLQGVRVNTPAKKGLYIINGKKVMVK